MDQRRRPWFQIDVRAHSATAASGPKGSGNSAAKAAANKPFWADWGANLNRQSASISKNAQGWWQLQSKNAKKWKWEMPVKVDVDFLNPIIDSVKKTTRDTWRQLPPEVQGALPFVAVAFTSGLIVYKIQHGKYVREAAKSERLSNRVDGLLEERNDLRAANKELKAKALAPKSASEMRMAAAVAEATTAAAAAASAAASAASSCIVSVGKPQRQ